MHNNNFVARILEAHIVKCRSVLNGQLIVLHLPPPQDQGLHTEMSHKPNPHWTKMTFTLLHLKTPIKIMKKKRSNLKHLRTECNKSRECIQNNHFFTLSRDLLHHGPEMFQSLTSFLKKKKKPGLQYIYLTGDGGLTLLQMDHNCTEKACRWDVMYSFKG